MRSRIGLAAATALAIACSDAWSPARDPGNILIVSGDGQVGTVGVPLPRDLVVQVLARDTLPLRGVRVVFRTTAGNARISNEAMETDSLGLASARVTPTGPGNIQVTVAVYSSRISVPFLLAAVQQAPVSPCSGTPLSPAPAEIVTDVGGAGICVAAGPTGAEYVLAAFNSATGAADSTTLVVSGTGNVPVSSAVRSAQVSALVPRAGAVDRPAIVSGRREFVRPTRAPSPPAILPELFPLARAWRRLHDFREPAALLAATDQVGDVRVLNARLDESCTTSDMRSARVVAITRTAIVAVDTASPANGFTDDEYRGIGLAFDTLWNPVDTLSFKPPTDIDDNRHIVLFFTPAVNGLPPDGNGPRVAVLQRRDLLPRTSTGAGKVCATSNVAELLYGAVPDETGAMGPVRRKSDIQRNLGRLIVHEYQHLINASRRIYVNGASRFEDPWLDEALSQAAEELLFQQMAPRPSRQNLGAVDLSATRQTLDAFLVVQRPNVENYRRFLDSTGRVSALSPDAPGTRGASWSLLRYLIDRRAYFDYVSFTDLANSPTSGFDNLRAVFGPTLRHQLRDWSVSLLTDDLFATGPAYQQPSWNFASIFSALGEATVVGQRALPPSGAETSTIAPLGSLYLTFAVPANARAAVTWSGAGSGAISPFVQWTLVRTR